MKNKRINIKSEKWFAQFTIEKNKKQIQNLWQLCAQLMHILAHQNILKSLTLKCEFFVNDLGDFQNTVALKGFTNRNKRKKALTTIRI